MGARTGKFVSFLQFVVVTAPYEPTAASAPTGIGFRPFGLRWFFFSQDNNEFGKGTNGSPNGKIRFFLQFVVVTAPYEPTAASAPTGIVSRRNVPGFGSRMAMTGLRPYPSPLAHLSHCYIHFPRMVLAPWFTPGPAERVSFDQ
jgi:hypothetical protein